MIIHYAITRIGAISNPLIPIYRGSQIKFMLEVGEAVAIFIPSEFRGFNYVEMVERIWPELPDLKHVVVLGDRAGKGMISWNDFINTPWEEKRLVSSLAELRPDPNDITELIFTSGTTGEPKGVLHTSNTLIPPNLGG